MDWRRGSPAIPAIVRALLLASALSASVWGQGLQQSPYSTPSVVRGGLDIAPSNPSGVSSGVGQRGSDSIYPTPQLFQGILPLIPNLQAGTCTASAIPLGPVA